MSPLPSAIETFHDFASRLLRLGESGNVGSPLSDHWKGLNYLLPILMIIGPEVIQRALTQLSGSELTPVVFSFGWVAYAFNALSAGFGNGRLLPDADHSAIIVPAKSGHIRENKSWIVGRLLRDHEQLSPKIAHRDDKGEGHEALRVTIFEVSASQKPGTITRDSIYYSGFLVMAVQLMIAFAPIILREDWTTFTVTVAGTILALLQGSLPHWRKEKWACPDKRSNTISITQGNGSRHAMVILEDKHNGLDLEILGSRSKQILFSRWELVGVSTLTMLWTILLISVSGMDSDSWYLLVIGLIGMIHNVFVAGAPRDPGALGIHLKQKDVISSGRVTDVLYQAEQRYPMVGSSLVPIFFPGGMRVPEPQMSFWSQAQELRSRYGSVQLNITPEKNVSHVGCRIQGCARCRCFFAFAMPVQYTKPLYSTLEYTMESTTSDAGLKQ